MIIVLTGFLIGLILDKRCEAAKISPVIPRQGFHALFQIQTLPFFSGTNDSARKEFLSVNLPQHRVRPGETLYSLSRYYFVSLESLKGLNQVRDPENLEVGQELFIPPVDYQSKTLRHYQMKSGETVMEIISRYNLQKYQMQRLNPNINLNKAPVGSDLVVPSQPFQQKAVAYLGIHFINPVKGLLTSRYGFRWGRMHYGLDLAAPLGTPVKAADMGNVEFSGWASGYGLLIKIDHGQYATKYGHLSKSFVVPGMRVAQGQIIGLVGATGHAFGSHLHFEVEKAGLKINPYQFIYN